MADSAGSISVSLDADTARFDAAVTNSAATAEKSFARISGAQNGTTAAGDRLLASLKKQVDTFGMSGTQLLAYQASLRGVSDQAAPLIARLEQMKAANDAVGEGAGHAGAGTATFTRELIRLGREASTGEYTRLAGTFVVLATHSQTMLGALSGLLGPIGAVAVALAAVAFAAYEAFQENKVFADSLQLTGNYAGLTKDSFDAMAASIAKLDNAPIGKVKTALQEVVSTGRFTGATMQAVATAAVNLSKVNGKSTEEIIKSWAGMADNVTASALKLNESAHFLTEADIEYVRQLQSQGKVQDAVLVVMDKYNERLKTQTENVGFFAKAWQNYGNWYSSFWNSAKQSVGPSTDGQQLAEAQARLADLQQQKTTDSGGAAAGSPQLDDAIAKQQKLVAAIQARVTAETKGAADTSTTAKDSEDDILFHSTAFQAALLSLAQAGFMDRAARAKAARDEMQEGIDKSYETGELTLKGYIDAEFMIRKAALTDQLTLIEESKKAIQARQPTTPEDSLNQYKQILEVEKGRYAIEVALRKLADERLRTPGALAPKTLVDANVATPQETFSRFERSGQPATEASYKANQEAVEAFVQSLKAQGAAVDAEAAKMNAETATMGLSALDRAKLVAVTKLQSQATEELRLHSGASVEINAQLAKSIDTITGAYDRNYAAQHSFSFGATQTFQKYQEDAANASKFAETVIGGGLSRTEDALTKFVETGKLSFTGLFEFMADQYIRNLIKMQIAGATGANGSASGLFGALTSMIGYGSSGWGSASSTSGAVAGGGAGSAGDWFASYSQGTNFVPSTGLALLHEGEAVVPKAYNGGGVMPSGASKRPLTVVVNAPPGVQHDSTTQSDDGSSLQVYLKMAESHIAGQIANNRGPVPQALNSRGIATHGALARRA